MSLKAFEFAETEAGYHYELSRGYVTVSEVANYFHGLLVALIRQALIGHQSAHPEQIHVVLAGNECKVLAPTWESERHPDIAVYFNKPKGPKNRKLWRSWSPDLVVEVVSERSTDRDYVQKREEYWTLGIKEYWLFDAKRQQVLLLTRGKSDWIEKRLSPEGTCNTKLLPGFKLSCHLLVEAAAQADFDEE